MLETLLAELRALREEIGRDGVDKTSFESRTNDIRTRGGTIGVDFSDEIEQLRILAGFDIDLSTLVRQLQQLDRLARSGSITREQFDASGERILNTPVLREADPAIRGQFTDELNRIGELGSFASSASLSVSDLAANLFFFREGVQVLTSSLTALISPFKSAIDQKRITEELNISLSLTRVICKYVI